MKVVILCGGKGTRLREKTEEIPKALVEIGGQPILWHIMKLYSAFGFRDFVLCLGHLGHKIKERLIEDSDWRRVDCRLQLGSPEGPKLTRIDSLEPWNIVFADTGLDTSTGGRIKKVQKYVQDEDFMVTYGDGLSDLNITEVVEFHRRHGKIATVTAVNPASTFGVMSIEKDGCVTAFQEKPRLGSWINGGFFVFRQEVFDYLDEGSALEREPLQRLAGERQLRAYCHEGFWACMDTFKDSLQLNEMWERGEARWKTWER
jgi:glucose-1-phosphate cytidylyltransferase